MSANELYFQGLPQIAVVVGATTPAGDRAGQQAWSTTLAAPVFWDGSAWRLLALYRLPVSVGTATYTVGLTDLHLIFSVACTVTLPSAANFGGRELNLKSIFAGAVISNASNVKPLASNTAGTAILAATAGKFSRLVSDGSSWVTMAAN